MTHTWSCPCGRFHADQLDAHGLSVRRAAHSVYCRLVVDRRVTDVKEKAT